MTDLPNASGGLSTENLALRRRIAALEAELAIYREQARPATTAADAVPRLHDIYPTVLDQLPVGVAIAAAPSGELLFHNAEAVRLLRHPLLPSADYRGYAQYGALHPDGRAYAPDEYPIARALLHQASIPPEDMLYRRGDGTMTTFAVAAAPVRDAAGHVVAVVSTFYDVAAQRATGTALREREQQLTSVIESVDGRVWSVDRELRLLIGNAYFQRDVLAITGRALLPGESIWSLPMPPEWRATWQASYERALAGETFALERQTAGTTMAYRFKPIQTPEGEIRGVTVFGLDITSRVQAEIARYETERKLGTLFELLPIGISILDADRNVVYANPALNQILGIDQADLSQKAYRQRQYLRPDGTPMPIVEFASTRMFHEQQPILDLETGVVIETGETRWMSVSAVPVDFPDWRSVIVTTDLTARKRVEQLLRESQERTAGIVESAMDAIISLDETHRIIVFNAAAERIFGCPAGEALGQSLDGFIPAQFRNTHAGHIRAFGRSGVTKRSMQSQGTLNALRADGSEFPVEATISQVIAAGETMYTVIIRDITERKQAELQLWRQQEILREQAELLDHAHVLIRDLDSKIVFWNTGAEQLYGWSKAEAIGQVTHVLFQTQFPESFEAVQTQLFGQGSWEGELQHTRQDGTALHVASHQVLHRDERGTPIAILEVNNDITERKQAEQAMRRASERLRTLADASRAFAEASADQQALLDIVARIMAERLLAACSIRLLSDDGQWLEVAALGHYDPAQLAGMQSAIGSWRIPLGDRAPAAVVARTGHMLFVPAIDRAALRASLSPEQQGNLEHFFPHSMIVMPLRLHGHSIGSLALSRSTAEPAAFDSDDLNLVLDLTDRAVLAIANTQLLAQVREELAERTHAEQALVAERALLARRVAERTADLSVANAELARAARLKDEFLASMSHELRTPLNSILGRSQALQEQIYGPLAAKQIEVLHGVEESGYHLLSLINDILDLSKIEAGKLDLEIGTVDVDLLCRASLRLVAQAALQKRIHLTSTVDILVDTIAADERRLKQILVNLLSNAVKFTPAGGRVGLEIGGDPARESVTFTVWDTGIGIAAEDLPKLFQPFTQIDSRLSRQYEGTGLGLALVRRLAEAHGGSVSLESTPGQGSRFRVALPWRPAEAGRAPNADPPAPAEQPQASSVRALERPRILLAEDNESNIELVEYYLQAKGYDVVVARNGGEALVRVEEAPPQAILMDIQMPGMDGLEAIRRIRADANLRAIPIIAMTALAMPGDRERCLQAGADDYLTKPVDLAKLVATLAGRLKPAQPLA